MNKQSVNSISPDSPEAPDEAVDAATADPAARSEDEQESTQTTEDEDDEDENEDESDEELKWIELELQDDEGNPMPNEPFKVKLPDGKMITGSLDKEGKAKVEGIKDAGDCDIFFHKIHGDEWDLK